MKAVEFVERLEKVRQTGNARWTACCPAHADRHPSLIVSEGDDGRVLVHCFAGCGIDAIAAAVGVEVSDLMPQRLPEHRYRPIRKPFPAADVLECLATQTRVVQLLAAEVAQGPLNPQARDALRDAVELIQRGREFANG